MRVLSLHTTLFPLVHIQFKDQIASRFASSNLFFYGSISTTIYFLALTWHLSFSVCSCSLSFHVVYITCVSSWKQTLGIFHFIISSPRELVKLVVKSVGSGGRLFRLIFWLSSVLTISPSLSSFTFLFLHLCICTMEQVIILQRMVVKMNKLMPKKH